MRKPSVFISSTCYDLRQLRADIHAYLDNAGFDPVLSEYTSFPVDPDVATIENCRKNVENRADIFVLIIGARYGSTDKEGKSITNLEYLTARAKGIPIYVFAMQSILTILPVWRANPTADYKSVADSPKLFEFVTSIRDSGEKWVFPFETAQDIVHGLRTQLAYLFADALDLRKRAASSGALADKYRHVSGRELRLLIERSRSWEYLLFSEALLRELRASADLKRDWGYKVALGAMKSQSPSEFIRFSKDKNSEAVRLFSNLTRLFHEALPAAFGPDGTPGDPDSILYVANRVGDIYRAALQWKLAFFSISLPEPFTDSRASMPDYVTTRWRRSKDSLVSFKAVWQRLFIGLRIAPSVP